ncbi:MAG: GGDEF domain-containing protein [Lachnospiraceae bacterium]|nr:GGDEF domain-containing protein [Lachnospiraceae bacterium]
MQYNLIDKILLDPEDYPDVSKSLIYDFNNRIKNISGISSGLGREYHIIWLIRIKDHEMELYRNTGEDTTRGVIEYGLDYKNYDDFIKAYVENYVVDRTDNIEKEVSFDTVMKNIESGEMYTIDYMRMSDDGELSYFQMAFALTGEPEHSNYFTLAFRNIDKTIKKHIADKRYLREQLDIVAALSRDYYNIFKLDMNTRTVVILKLDGYVTKGMEGPGEKSYPYDVLYAQYVKDRVYSEDIPSMMEAMSLDVIREKLKEVDEYVSSYRVIDKDEIHYYQFTYLPLNPNNPSSGVLAAFKNVDDIVESAKEREALVAMAKTDLMTGLLNRGSGESRVKESLSGYAPGMMCVIDIDEFKNINDTFGHDIGDKVIRGIADIISTEFSKNDIVFRLGGDEYGIYSEETIDEKSGTDIINRIFKRISRLDIPELKKHRVSVSAGAVIRNTVLDRTFEDIYRKADLGVYKSKEQSGSSLTFFKQ